MIRKKLRITWKIIRKEGQSRNVNTYCTYIAENEEHKHRLKTIENTKLFELLENTIILKKGSDNTNLYIDGIYRNNKLIFVTNFRKM